MTVAPLPPLRAPLGDALESYPADALLLRQSLHQISSVAGAIWAPGATTTRAPMTCSPVSARPSRAPPSPSRSETGNCCSASELGADLCGLHACYRITPSFIEQRLREIARQIHLEIPFLTSFERTKITHLVVSILA